MRYRLDAQDIGMFGPEDLDRLATAYASLCGEHAISDNEEACRRLARALIQLYRHGVREPQQLVSALRMSPAA
ncbi:hypothetical protein [Rhizobium sp. FKL33]|uniref:hypothetical protein n=1 Tax=Rhizobium sp. FKL33 TaxID=2562307 RepID=UPI0010C05EB1|nr:hypothetical protein [Rhizobium sp. FKL33]